MRLNKNMLEFKTVSLKIVACDLKNLNWSPVICRNTQMILQLWGESVMDKRLSTENWWTILWDCVGTII